MFENCPQEVKHSETVQFEILDPVLGNMGTWRPPMEMPLTASDVDADVDGIVAMINRFPVCIGVGQSSVMI